MSFIAANKVYTSTNKTTIVLIQTELFSLPGVDASHVYVRALALGCFYSHISTGTFRRIGQLRGDKERPFSGVTKSGRVWRKVPESDARSVGWPLDSHDIVQTKLVPFSCHLAPWH